MMPALFFLICPKTPLKSRENWFVEMNGGSSKSFLRTLHQWDAIARKSHVENVKNLFMVTKWQGYARGFGKINARHAFEE